MNVDLYYYTIKKLLLKWTQKLFFERDLCWFSCKTCWNKHGVPQSREFNPDSSSVKSIMRLFFYFGLGHLCCKTLSLSSFSKDTFEHVRSNTKIHREFLEVTQWRTWRLRRKSLCENRKQRVQHERWYHTISRCRQCQYLLIMSNSIINCRIHGYNYLL